MSLPLAIFTCSILRLDPLGVAPLEQVLDIVPGLSPLRVTFDTVDNESATYEYDVTEHPVGSVADITSNVRKRLESITISGTLSRAPPLLPVPPPALPSSVLQLDLLRFRNLKAIADARQPIMLVTPRVGLPRALITSLQEQWTPADTESIAVTITVREARLVSPIIGAELATDYPAQTPGNNAATGGGQSSTTTLNQGTTPSGVTGLPPTLKTTL